MSEPLCMVIVPSWSMMTVTGTVSDSDRPSADTVAVAVPVYVPAREEGGAVFSGGAEPVPAPGVEAPPPVDVSLLLLLQPENTNSRVKRMVMPVYCRVKIFIFRSDFLVGN